MQKLCLYILVLVTFSSLAAATTATAADELKIVYNVGVAPLKFEDPASRPAGLFPDLWRLWAQKVGRQIEFVRVNSFDESLQMLKSGEVDLHAGLFRTPQREKFLDYSEPLLALNYYIFTHPSVYPIKSLERTAGLIVGIQKGGYTEQFVRSKVPANRIAVYDRFQDLFRAALEGEIKVFVATELSLLYFLRENYQTNIFEYDRDRPLYSQVYYTATAKGNPALIQEVNDGLKAIGSAERKKLEDKWIVMDFKELSRAPADTASKKETGIGLSAAEEDFLKSHPVIRVHNEKDWPPFNYFEYGNPRGLSIDYMNLLAERLGIKVEYVTGPSWDEFLGMIQHKDLDVMLNIVKTEDRLRYLLFTEPYMQNSNVLVSAQEKPYESLTALFGKTVAVPEGFFYEEVLAKSFPRIKRLQVENTLASLKAVMFGRAQAAMGKAVVVRTLINKNLLTGLRISGEVNIGDPDLTNLRIGVRTDWPLLHSALMKAMAAVTPQEMNAIRQKWMMVGIEPGAEQAAGSISYGRLALYGLAVFLVLSLLAWILIRTIQRANISFNFGSRWFRRLVLAGLSLFIIIVCLLGLFTLEQNRAATLKSIGDNLKETLKTADNRLDLWVAQRTSLLKLLGRDPELVTLTKRLLAVTPDQDTLRTSEALQDVRSFFKNNKNFLSNSEFFIINKNHATIGSLNDSSLGRPNVISIRKPDLIRHAFEGDVLIVPPVQLDDAAVREPQANGAGSPSVKFFIGPILDTNGQILALMALGVDPAKDFSWVLPASETRKTGETYAFDERGRMLSESLFDDQLRLIGLLAEDQASYLNIEIKDPGVNLVKGQRPEIERSQQPLTRMASRAFQLKLDMEKAGQTYGRSNMEIDTTGYRDYRGVPVFGAWLWNAELGLGLATEIDLKEAMSHYYQVRRTVVWVLGFTLLVSVGAVLLVLMLGERTSRALMKARDNLEAKVSERTAELQDKQTQLEAAVERSRLILDSAGEGIFGVNLEDKAAFINPAANRMLGYESDELIGQKVHEIIHHSYADGSGYPKEKCPMYLSYADGTDHHVSNELLWRKDGTAFPVEYTSMPIKKDGRVVGAVVTFMDIAERMKAEEDVRRNQEQLQVVLESIQAVAFLKDRQGRHLLVNRFYENAVGVKKEDILGKTDLEIFPAEAARQIIALDEEVMSSGKIQTIEEEIPHPDGSLHAYLTTKVPLFDKDGVVYGMCGLATDITDRKRVEETLTRERERLQNILDASPVGVGISTEGVVRFANPRFAELFYSQKGEAAQDAYVDPKDREYIVNQLKRTGIVRDYELQTYGPNREIRETLATFISTEYEGQNGILAWMVDLSNLKEAEKELRARFDELARFRRLAIGREQKMIELKKEINELLKTNSLPKKYKIH